MRRQQPEPLLITATIPNCSMNADQAPHLWSQQQSLLRPSLGSTPGPSEEGIHMKVPVKLWNSLLREDPSLQIFKGSEQTNLVEVVPAYY